MPTRRRAFDPALLLWIVLAAVLIFLVVNPLFRLVQLSLEDTDTGAFTLMNYVTAYSRQRYITATWNSLALGFWVTVLCLIFAVPVAWAVSRTDMPCKGAIRLLVLGAFVTPPYLGAIGWILLAGPNSGWLNRVWMTLTGAHEGLFNIYSFSGLAFEHCALLFPVPVHLHLRGTRRGVLGNGRRRQHPRCRHAAHHVAHHAAAGAPGDPWRRHRHLSGSHRAVRHAGADRHPRALQCRRPRSSCSSSASRSVPRWQRPTPCPCC